MTTGLIDFPTSIVNKAFVQKSRIETSTIKITTPVINKIFVRKSRMKQVSARRSLTQRFDLSGHAILQPFV